MQITVIAPEQSRAARALLGKTSGEVAKDAGMGINTIQRFERGDQAMNLATLQKLTATYQRYGVEFPDEFTVRWVRGPSARQAA